MQPKPYVGITGFGHRVEVDSVLKALPPDTDRLVMIGVGVCGSPLKPKGEGCPNRYPRPPILGEIFPPYPNVLNLLHVHVHEENTLLEYMCLAHELAGSNCHGVQINHPWPEKALLENYKVSGTKRTIVLPFDKKALDQVGWQPRALARRFREYDGIVDYVVMDTSGGTGRELDTPFARECFDAIRSLMPTIGLVAAGGLCADNVESKLADLLHEFSLSTDAEGKLRTPTDQLNVSEAIRYVRTTDTLLRKYGAVR